MLCPSAFQRCAASCLGAWPCVASAQPAFTATPGVQRYLHYAQSRPSAARYGSQHAWVQALQDASAQASASHQSWIQALQDQAAAPALSCHPKALFVDAAGTFLVPSEEVPDVYLRYSRPHGISPPPGDVLARFRSAYNHPGAAGIRYVGDARDFWRRVVSESLGTDNERVFEDIYAYYARPEAWRVPPGARDALDRIRAIGVRVCIVSNFDSRLRPLLRALQMDDAFDAVVVSSEVGAEKPSPAIFDAACVAVGVDPAADHVIHVGDDRRNDVWGARDFGLRAWLWGTDVKSFDEIADRIVTGHTEI